jgi:AcrR family transcriptional regulator
VATLTREKLLAGATAELLAEGWEKTTGTGIKRRAKVSHGSWAHFFPGGKPEIAAEIYGQLHDELWSDGLLGFKFEAGSKPQPALASALTALLRSIERQPTRWRLLLQLEASLPQVERGELVLSRQSMVHQTIADAALRLRAGEPITSQAALIAAVVIGPAVALAAHWLAQPPSTRTEKLASADNVAVLANSAFRPITGLRGPRALARQASANEPKLSQTGLFEEGQL